MAFVAGGAVFVLAALLVDPTSPCDSDEGHHVLSALRFSRALSTHDFSDFARHTLKGGRYPFLHGWAGAAVFSVFGEGLFAIRLLSSLLLGASAALVAALFFALRPRAHALWALPLGAAVALAPECLANGTIAMLEVPGLFLVTFGAFAYQRHAGTGGRGWALGAGLAAVVGFYVKYPYGAYLLLPLGLSELLRARFRILRLLRVPSLLVWGPATAALLLWLAIPQSRASILTLLGDAPDSVIREARPDPLRVPVVQPAVFAFYLGTLFRSVTPGILAGALLGVGAIMAFVRGGRFERVVLAGGLLWTILTLSLSYRTFGVDRFLVPAAGLFVVLGAVGLADFWTLARRTGARAGSAALTLGMVLLVAAAGEAAWRLPRTLGFARAAVETGPREKQALRWIVGAVETPANLLVVGNWDQLSEDAIRIEFLLTRRSARFSDLDVKAIRREKIYDGTKRLDRWFSEESVHHPPGEPVRPRAVLFVHPSTDARRGDVDAENFARILSRASALTAASPWVESPQASVPLAEFLLRRAPPAD
jgi:hypothetical protein